MISDQQPATDYISSIFISYRRDDSGGYAGHLYTDLSNHFRDSRIFMDIDSIEYGEDFVKSIEEAVSSCDVLVALIGKQWLTITDETGHRRLDNPEDFVHLEIATALERNIRVIPLLLQGTSMPRAQDLPSALVSLARRNALELSERRWNYDIGLLIKTLERILPKRNAGNATITSKSSTREIQQLLNLTDRIRALSRRKWVRIVGLVLFLSLSVIILKPFAYLLLPTVDDPIITKQSPSPEMQQQVKVVFFDLGDTLVTNNRTWTPGAQNIIAELKRKRIRLGIISNTGDLSRTEFFELLPPDFDIKAFEDKLIILSSEVNLMKPDLRIFRLAIERAGVEASECVFITEAPTDINVAANLGMKTVRYQNLVQQILGGL